MIKKVPVEIADGDTRFLPRNTLKYVSEERICINPKKCGTSTKACVFCHAVDHIGMICHRNGALHRFLLEENEKAKNKKIIPVLDFPFCQRD